jgi:two-component system cell cycle response regulator DivK
MSARHNSIDNVRRQAASCTRCQIKSDPNFKATPIIAVSSFAMKGDEDKARASGCDHYVTKPYSPIQLLRIIRGFLGEQA